jgi:hypothetical protein
VSGTSGLLVAVLLGSGGPPPFSPGPALVPPAPPPAPAPAPPPGAAAAPAARPAPVRRLQLFDSLEESFAPAPAHRVPSRYLFVPHPGDDGDHLQAEGFLFDTRIAPDGTLIFLDLSRSAVFNNRLNAELHWPRHQMRGPARPWKLSPVVNERGERPTVDEVLAAGPLAIRQLPETFTRVFRYRWPMPPWISIVESQRPHHKREVLKATLDLRTEMAARQRQAAVAAALEDLPAELQAIWSDRALPPEERQRVIRAIGDEADDSPAGRRAREIVREFLHRRGAPPD